VEAGPYNAETVDLMVEGFTCEYEN
jgi:hypothetical protein